MLKEFYHIMCIYVRIVSEKISELNFLKIGILWQSLFNEHCVYFESQNACMCVYMLLLVRIAIATYSLKFQFKKIERSRNFFGDCILYIYTYSMVSNNTRTI